MQTLFDNVPINELTLLFLLLSLAYDPQNMPTV